jgi:hypothetical protein
LSVTTLSVAALSVAAALMIAIAPAALMVAVAPAAVVLIALVPAAAMIAALGEGRRGGQRHSAQGGHCRNEGSHLFAP